MGDPRKYKYKYKYIYIYKLYIYIHTFIFTGVSYQTDTDTSRRLWPVCTGSLFARVTCLISSKAYTFSITPVLLDNHIYPIEETSKAASKSFSSCVRNLLPARVSSAMTLPVFRRVSKHYLFLDSCHASMHRPPKANSLALPCHSLNAFQPSAYN